MLNLQILWLEFDSPLNECLSLSRCVDMRGTTMRGMKGRVNSWRRKQHLRTQDGQVKAAITTTRDTPIDAITEATRNNNMDKELIMLVRTLNKPRGMTKHLKITYQQILLRQESLSTHQLVSAAIIVPVHCVTDIKYIIYKIRLYNK